MQVVVGASIVCGKVESGVLVGQVCVAHVRSRPIHALIACIALAFVRVEVLTQLGVSVIAGYVCHGPSGLCRGEDGRPLDNPTERGGIQGLSGQACYWD